MSEIKEESTKQYRESIYLMTNGRYSDRQILYAIKNQEDANRFMEKYNEIVEKYKRNTWGSDHTNIDDMTRVKYITDIDNFLRLKEIKLKKKYDDWIEESNKIIDTKRIFIIENIKSMNMNQLLQLHNKMLSFNTLNAIREVFKVDNKFSNLLDNKNKLNEIDENENIEIRKNKMIKIVSDMLTIKNLEDIYDYIDETYYNRTHFISIGKYVTTYNRNLSEYPLYSIPPLNSKP